MTDPTAAQRKAQLELRMLQLAELRQLIQDFDLEFASIYISGGAFADKDASITVSAATAQEFIDTLAIAEHVEGEVWKDITSRNVLLDREVRYELRLAPHVTLRVEVPKSTLLDTPRGPLPFLPDVADALAAWAPDPEPTPDAA